MTDDKPHAFDLRTYIEQRCVPEPNTGCWLWLLWRDHLGYGRTKIIGKSRLAHRKSYEAFVGQIPDGLDVLHACDTPACVNPDHLSVGTPTENARQMVDRGRNADMRGSKNPWSKITESDVARWRAMPPRRGLYSAIAREEGFSKVTVRDVILGKRWGHV